MAWTDQDEQEYQDLKSQFDAIRLTTLKTEDKIKNPELYGEQGLEEVPGPITNLLTAGVGGIGSIGAKVLPNIAKPIGEAVLPIAETAGRTIGQGASALGKIAKRTITGSATESIPALEQQLASMPLTKITRAEELAQTLSNYSKKISESRSAIGVPQQTDLSLLPDIGKGGEAAAYMKGLTEVPVKELARQGAKKLLALRDVGQAVKSGASAAEKAIISKGMSHINDALEWVDEATGEVGTAYKGYGLAKQQVKSWPKDYQKNLIEMKGNLSKTKLLADKEKFIRQIGWGGAALVGGVTAGKSALMSALRRLGGGQ